MDQNEPLQMDLESVQIRDGIVQFCHAAHVLALDRLRVDVVVLRLNIFYVSKIIFKIRSSMALLPFISASKFNARELKTPSTTYSLTVKNLYPLHTNSFSASDHRPPISFSLSIYSCFRLLL